MEFQKFIIKKGENVISKWNIKPFFDIKNISYEVIFNETSIYKGFQDFKNNLFGLKFLTFSKNSVEFTWYYSPGLEKVIIGTRVFKNGVKYTRNFVELEINKIYIFKMAVEEDYYDLSISNDIDKVINYTRTKKPKNNFLNFGFLTFPDFFNYKNAPQNIEIILRKI